MPNKINTERIKQFAGEIKEALRFLRESSALPKERVLENPILLGSIKYNLIVSIQGCIDICNHILAKRGTRAPQDYADCFQLMSELGFLEKPLAERLVRMSRFRNLLIHLYWRVDDERVYQILAENLGDFEEFLKAIGKVIGMEKGKGNF